MVHQEKVRHELSSLKSRERLIWDLPTRIFHWGFALCIVCAFAFAQFRGPLFYWHVVFGIACGLLLIWRILWGFIGSRHARFRSLIFPFRETAQYFKAVISGKGRYYAGHNPGSALAIWLMLILSAITVVSGLKAGNDTLEAVHKLAANLLMLFVLAHVAGILIASNQHHQNYFASMFTGKKRANSEESITNSSPLAAVVMVTFVLVGTLYFISGLDFRTGVFHAYGTNFSFAVGESEGAEHSETAD